MPSGTVHNFTTVVMAGTAAAFAWRMGYPYAVTAPLAGGVLLGLYLSPDLDVDSGCIANHNARRLAGGFFGMLWEVIWKPYSMMIPHRSVLSHTPVLGTAIRLGYLALVMWVIGYAFHLTGLTRLPQYQPWMLWVFVGLCLSDLVHFYMDITFHNSTFQPRGKNVR